MLRRNCSWPALLGFCATWSLIAALGFAILIASAALAFAGSEDSVSSPGQPSSSTNQRTFAGVITDSECQARHAADSGKSPAECVRECLRKGAKLMLVDGEKSYFLQGDPAALQKLAGQRAKVSGTLDGSVIQVAFITQE